MNRVPIEESFSLPGYTSYKGRMPREVTLRAMTTVEEKLRVSSSSTDVVPRIIQNCITTPNVNVMDLKVFDLYRLLFGLRCVTYGSDYNIKVRCTNCGKIHSVAYDLSSLEIKDTPEDFADIFDIGPLPVTGDVITCKMLTCRDLIETEQEITRRQEKFPEADNIAYNVYYEKKIVAINGEKLAPPHIDQYIDTLNMKDVRFLDSRYSEYADVYGINQNATCTCDKCGKEFVFVLPMTDEFFRPTI